MLSRLHGYAAALSRVLLVICCGFLVIMTVTIGALVVSRYVFSHSFPWAEELTRYMLIWLVLLAAAMIQRRDDHIRVAVVVDLLPSRLRAVITFGLRLLIIGFAILLVRSGWSAALGMGITRSPALGIDMTLPYLAIPVGAALLLAFSLLSLTDDVRAMLGWPRLQRDRQPD